MLEADYSLWAVGLLFYLPLHLGLPLLFGLLQGSPLSGALLRGYLLLELAWLVFTFVAAMLLANFSPWLAIAMIVISLPRPWWHIHRLLKKP